ncbi:MAG: hypothetical protein V4585_08585 [Bacteroidota bacterium]|jgi:hypothetical protein
MKNTEWILLKKLKVFLSPKSGIYEFVLVSVIALLILLLIKMML